MGTTMGTPEGDVDALDDDIDDLVDDCLGDPVPHDGLEVEDISSRNQLSHSSITLATGSSTLPLAEDSLPRVVAALDAPELSAQLTAAARLRRLLSADDPPIKEAVGRGAVPRLVELLRRDSSPRLQLEAAWALTNIASGAPEHVRAVVDGGALAPLCRLLRASDSAVREQAAWALGNIAGDGAKMRDKVLVAGALAPLVRTLRDAGTAAMQSKDLNKGDNGVNLDKHGCIDDGEGGLNGELNSAGSLPLAALRTCVWALSNLVRGKPAPPLQKVASALPILAELTKVDDEEVLTDVCWALSYLGERSEGVDAVIETGVCERLASLLSATSPSVQKSALHAVGNIVAGSQVQAQAALDGGALPLLTTLLSSSDAEVQRLAAWAISNVTAGSSDQIQAVINNRAVAPLLLLLKAPSRAVRKEAAFAIVNVTTSPWPQHTHRLVEQGVIEPLCELLSIHEPSDIITVTLEGLQNILKVSAALEAASHDCSNTDHRVQMEIANNIKSRVEEAGKTRMIELCEHDKTGSIHSIAMGLLTTYFDVHGDALFSQKAAQFKEGNKQSGLNLTQKHSHSDNNVDNESLDSIPKVGSNESQKSPKTNRSKSKNRKGKTASDDMSGSSSNGVGDQTMNKSNKSSVNDAGNTALPISPSPVSSSPLPATLSTRASNLTSAEMLAQDNSNSTPSTSAASSTTTSTTSNGQRVEFVVNIKNFTARRNRGHPAGQYSEVFDGKKAGRWRLLSYTHGTVAGKDGEWLSLYVSSADVDELACKYRWSRTVDYSITLVHPIAAAAASGINIKMEKGNKKDSSKTNQSENENGSNLSVTRRHTSVVFRGVHNDYEWGCRDFLPSDQVVEQGFLLNDSLLVRVEVELRDDAPGQPLTVLSDAELRGHLAWAAENGLPRACLACLTTYACNNGKTLDLGKGFGSTKANHAALTQHLAAAASDLVSATCSEEWGTPLHLACIGWRPGNSRVVTLLLDCGAPVDALNKHGETPLVLAAREGGQSAVVDTLLNRSANPCLCSKGGWSPMSAAASRGRDDIVRLLAKRGAPLEEVWPPLSALLEAAKAGHASAALTLLECGADPEVQDEKGNTALWILLEKNMTEAALCMVQRHHASVAQCSRERSKVQRAKLLLKHAQRRVGKSPSTVGSGSSAVASSSNFSSSKSLGVSGLGGPSSSGGEAHRSHAAPDEGRILKSGSVDFDDYMIENGDVLSDSAANNGGGGGGSSVSSADFASLQLDSADVAALDLVKELEEEENNKASKSSKNRKKKERAKLKKQQQVDEEKQKKKELDMEKRQKEEAKKKEEEEKRNKERREYEEKERIRREAAKLEWEQAAKLLEEQERNQAILESKVSEAKMEASQTKNTKMNELVDKPESKQQKHDSSKSSNHTKNSNKSESKSSNHGGGSEMKTGSQVKEAVQTVETSVKVVPKMAWAAKDTSQNKPMGASSSDDRSKKRPSAPQVTVENASSSSSSVPFSMAKLSEVKTNSDVNTLTTIMQMSSLNQTAHHQSQPSPWNEMMQPSSQQSSFSTLQTSSINPPTSVKSSSTLNLNASPFPAPGNSGVLGNIPPTTAMSSTSGVPIPGASSTAPLTFNSLPSNDVSSNPLGAASWGLPVAPTSMTHPVNKDTHSDIFKSLSMSPPPPSTSSVSSSSASSLSSLLSAPQGGGNLVQNSLTTNNFENDRNKLSNQEEIGGSFEMALARLGQLGTLLKRHISNNDTLTRIVMALYQHRSMDYATFLMMSEPELFDLGNLSREHVALLLEIQEEEVLSGVGMSFMNEEEDDDIDIDQAGSRGSMIGSMDFLLSGDDHLDTTSSLSGDGGFSLNHPPIHSHSNMQSHNSLLSQLSNNSVVMMQQQPKSTQPSSSSSSSFSFNQESNNAASLPFGLMSESLPEPELPWLTLLRQEIVKKMVLELKGIENALLNKTSSQTIQGTVSGGSVASEEEHLKNIPPGFVFVCSADTADEALAAGVFGLPGSHADDLQAAVDENTPIFLFNFSDGTLSGAWVADGRPDMNILPTAFSAPNRPTSRFPAQLRVKVPNSDAASSVSSLPDQKMPFSHGYPVNNGCDFQCYPHVTLQLDEENLSFTSKLAGHWSWFGVPGPISVEHTRDILDKMYDRSKENLIFPLKCSGTGNGSNDSFEEARERGSEVAYVLIMDWLLRDNSQQIENASLTESSSHEKHNLLSDDIIIPGFNEEELVNFIRPVLQQLVNNSSSQASSPKVELAIRQMAESCMNARKKWVDILKELDSNEQRFNHKVELNKIDCDAVELVYKLNSSKNVSSSDNDDNDSKKLEPSASNDPTISGVQKKASSSLSYSMIAKTASSNTSSSSVGFTSSLHNISLPSEFRTFIPVETFLQLSEYYMGGDNSGNNNNSQSNNDMDDDSLFYSHLFELVTNYETLALATVGSNSNDSNFPFSFLELCLPDSFIQIAQQHFDAIPCLTCPMSLPDTSATHVGSSSGSSGGGVSRGASSSVTNMPTSNSKTVTHSSFLDSSMDIRYSSMFHQLDKCWGSIGSFSNILSTLDATGGGSYLLHVPRSFTLNTVTTPTVVVNNDSSASAVNCLHMTPSMKLIDGMTKLLSNEVYPISFLVVMDCSSYVHNNISDSSTSSLSSSVVKSLHPSLQPWIVKSIVVSGLDEEPTKIQLKRLASSIKDPVTNRSDRQYLKSEASGTCIVILQNDAGSRTWSPNDEVLESLRKSLLPASVFEQTFGYDATEALGGSAKSQGGNTSWAKIVRSGN